MRIDLQNTPLRGISFGRTKLLSLFQPTMKFSRNRHHPQSLHWFIARKMIKKSPYTPSVTRRRYYYHRLSLSLINQDFIMICWRYCKRHESAVLDYIDLSPDDFRKMAYHTWDGQQWYAWARFISHQQINVASGCFLSSRTWPEQPSLWYWLGCKKISYKRKYFVYCRIYHRSIPIICRKYTL